LCASSCFFFQAEDGIRDRNVTGVQTCALPISDSRRLPDPQLWFALLTDFADAPQERMPEDDGYLQGVLEGVRVLNARYAGGGPRSEERRVGKECRSWWGTAD